MRDSPGAQQALAKAQHAYAATANQLGPYTAKLQQVVQPYLQAAQQQAEQLQKKFVPYFNRVQQQGAQYSSSLYRQSSDSLVPYLHQASARVSALLHWRPSK